MGLQEPQTWMQLQGVCPSPEVLLVRTPWARPIGKSVGGVFWKLRGTSYTAGIYSLSKHFKAFSITTAVMC